MPRTLAAIRAVLEREGVRFIDDETEGFGELLPPDAAACAPRGGALLCKTKAC